jgi:transglutaminase-like putative cysteine protease
MTASSNHLTATLHPHAGAVPCARYRVQHETRYQYENTVSLSQQYLHMTPREFAFQRTEAHSIIVTPQASDASEGCDYFGNLTRHIAITSPHDSLVVSADSTVALYPRHGQEQLKGSVPWEQVRDLLKQDRSQATLDACRYLYASPHVSISRALADYARNSFMEGRPQLEAAMDLTERIFREFEFDGSATDISTPLDQVLQIRRGVCQDFAQLMIGCLRSIGLAARYMSGYILTHPPPGQPRMIGADASHAWVSIYNPAQGWLDFDPTNRLLVQGEHVTTAWGRDYSDVTPMRGVVLGGGAQTLEVSVTMTPLPL